MKVILRFKGIFLLCFLTLSVSGQTSLWNEVAPGVWKMSACIPEKFYSWRDIQIMPDKKGKLKGVISKAEKGKPDNLGKVTWRFMSQ